MTERSVFPEFVAGIISLYIFQWMWGYVIEIQHLTSTLDASVAGNTTLILQGAMCVFVIGLYGIIGTYCILTCIERFTRFALEYKNRDKNAAEKPMKRVEDYIEDLQSTRK